MNNIERNFHQFHQSNENNSITLSLEQIIDDHLKGYDENSNKNLQALLAEILLTNDPAFNKFLFDLKKNNIPSFVCTKACINEPIYRCFDCDRISSDGIIYSIQCRNCFQYSEHSNHRVLQQQSSVRKLCNCGDFTCWAKEGFCQKHLGYSIECLTKINSLIPKDFETKITQAYHDIFCSLLYLFEKGIGDNSFTKVVENIIHKVIGNLEELNSHHIAFTFLITKILMQKSERKWKFKHICSDYEAIELNKISLSCDCTILELLIRYSPYMNSQINECLLNLIFKLLQDR